MGGIVACQKAVDCWVLKTNPDCMAPAPMGLGIDRGTTQHDRFT